jgi:hypothetical protein
MSVHFTNLNLHGIGKNHDQFYNETDKRTSHHFRDRRDQNQLRLWLLPIKTRGFDRLTIFEKNGEKRRWNNYGILQSILQ